MLMGRDLGIAAHQAHSRVRWAYDAKQVICDSINEVALAR